MNEDGWLETIAKFTGGGAGIGGGLYLVRWVILWLTGRHDARQAHIDADASELAKSWKAYRETLEARCDKQDEKIERQDAEIEKCHREKFELEERLVRLEAFADARGEMRQTKQIRESVEAVIQHNRDAPTPD